MQASEFIQRFYQLTPKPKAVLIAFLEGAEDEAIAAQLDLSTPTVRKHIQNLCDHFAIATEGELGKQNRRQTLYDLGQRILREWLVAKTPGTLQQLANSDAEDAVESPPTADLSPHLRGLPQTGALWGRQAELAQLSQWLIDPALRLIVVTGLPGCGKTSLATQAIAAVADHIEGLYWRSLSPPVSFLEWLDDGLNQAGKRPVSLLDTLERQINPLMALIRQKRCLLVFDDWHTLLAPQQFAGHYQPAYEDYQRFLTQMVETQGQSQVLILSQTLPTTVKRQLRPGMPIAHLPLGGLGEDAPLFLHNLGLTGEAAWPQLLETCGDRPGSLLLAQSALQSLFASNVERYLAFNPLGITEEHLAFVHESLAAMTAVEVRIVTLIALAEAPVLLPDLAPHIPLNSLGLLSALSSLDQRHWLQQREDRLGLDAAIANGIRHLFVQRLWQELQEWVRDAIFSKPSYWVDYDLQPLFANPQSHPQFHCLWRSYQLEYGNLLTTLPQECPLSLTNPPGHLATNWRALVNTINSPPTEAPKP